MLITIYHISYWRRRMEREWLSDSLWKELVETLSHYQRDIEGGKDWDVTALVLGFVRSDIPCLCSGLRNLDPLDIATEGRGLCLYHRYSWWISLLLVVLLQLSGDMCCLCLITIYLFINWEVLTRYRINPSRSGNLLYLGRAMMIVFGYSRGNR